MNENRKTRAFEETMLNEVRTQLILDTSYFNRLIERCTRVDTSIQAILNFYDSGSSDMDYFNLHTRNIRSGYNFQYHAGAYEALKASGVEKISNNEIRSALIDLYDFTLPRFRNFLNIFQSPEWHLMEEDLERQIFEYQIQTYKNGRKVYVAGYYKLEKSDHPVFKKYLDMKEEESSQGIGRIGGAINEVNKVLALLDEELGIKSN